MPTPAKVFCLFSVENNYDQPDNNLVAVWLARPSLEEVSTMVYNQPLHALNADAIVNVAHIFKGISTQSTLGGTAYRLAEVTVGENLER